MAYFILFLFINLVLIYLWLKRHYGYWKSRGINGPAPWPIVGNVGGIMLTKESVHDFANRLYQDYPNEEIVGFYQGLSPALLIRDPELMKQIAVKDYESFNSRGLRKRDDRFEDNLFLAEGETWKILRHKFNPLFTSGKMKKMMPLVEKCMENFIEYVDRLVTSGRREHDIRDLCRFLMLDINGTCCFGISMDVYSEKQNSFVDVAENIFHLTTTIGVKRFIEILYPRFSKIIIKFFNFQAMETLRQFFTNLIQAVVKEREEKQEKVGDLMDLLVELKAEGNIENGKATIITDDNFVSAQAIMFYAASFEPTSLILGFLFYEMALHQDIQQRLFEEISETASKYDGKVTQEGVKDMVYLKMVFHEVLRKYPASITRKCTQTYTFPDRNLTIEKGTTVILPVPGLHNDPKYFKDPEVFDPERFSPENRSKTSHVYLPFGLGPRYCIGRQFGRIQCLLSAANFLHQFRVYTTARTPSRLTTDPRFSTLRTVEGLWLGIARR